MSNDRAQSRDEAVRGSVQSAVSNEWKEAGTSQGQGRGHECLELAWAGSFAIIGVNANG
jgi:hypothetical protein